MSSPASPYILRRIPKLSPKAMFWLFPLLTSLCMSGTVSLVTTWRAVGWAEGLLNTWLSNWMAGWLVAFPILFVVLPLVRRISACLVRQP